MLAFTAIHKWEGWHPAKPSGFRARFTSCPMTRRCCSGITGTIFRSHRKLTAITTAGIGRLCFASFLFRLRASSATQQFEKRPIYQWI